MRNPAPKISAPKKTVTGTVSTQAMTMFRSVRALKTLIVELQGQPLEFTLDNETRKWAPVDNGDARAPSGRRVSAHCVCRRQAL